jgi:YHS domain-containing protein
MKIIKTIVASFLMLAVVSGPVTGFAADANKEKKLKPYLLKTCVVSDEKLGEMGEAYTFDYQGREVKLCCKSCLKDFKKNPAKYVKKMEDAEAKKKS